MSVNLEEWLATPAAIPDGYPLPSVDANGCTLRPGQQVRIPTIPAWLVHDMPADDAERLRAMEGATLPILGFDAYGHVWFGDDAPWFCVRPNEIVAPSE